MRLNHPTLILITLTLLTFTMLSCNGSGNDYQQQSLDERHHGGYAPGLALQMHFIQQWTHKLGLSVEAQNTELVDFYHHELEEGIEELMETIKEYDGFPIADLAGSFMIPAIESFEDAMDTGDWELIRDRYRVMIQACNSCHVATDHGFIKITDGFGNNPFNQDFSRD